jgi:myo-inositol-1(or 4)-monophosphatase
MTVRTNRESRSTHDAAGAATIGDDMQSGARDGDRGMSEWPLPENARRIAIATAREAGAILRAKLGQVAVEFKGLVDLVTEADRASETLIGGRLAAAFPDHRILGEEGIARAAGSAGDGGLTWVVDPLDGTTNFSHGYPHFAISIALALNEVVVLGVVYDPMRDELFVAERGRGATLNDRAIRVSAVDTLIRALLATGFSYDLGDRPAQPEIWNDFQGQTQGIRRDGAAALNLCYVAAGRLDGFWEQPLQPWDMAAGALIVEEAGGVVSGYAGGGFDPFGRGITAGNPAIHPLLVETVAARTGKLV